MTEVDLFPFAEYWWFYGVFGLFVLIDAGSRSRSVSRTGAQSFGTRGHCLECGMNDTGAGVCRPSLSLLSLEVPS